MDWKHNDFMFHLCYALLNVEWMSGAAKSTSIHCSLVQEVSQDSSNASVVTLNSIMMEFDQIFAI